MPKYRLPKKATGALASVKYTGDVERDASAECDAMIAAFRANDKVNRDKYRKIFDTEFHVTLCFQSREQKEEFLRLAKFDRWGQDKYLDGRKVARAMGIELTPDPIQQKPLPIDKDYAALADE